MSSMENLDKLQAELQGNVNPSVYDRLYNLTQLVSIEHAELMAQAMRYVRKEKVEPLEAENAKLRELVSDFDKCLTEAARLAYIQGHMTIYDGTLLDSLHPRMRELGMETSE